MSRPAAFVIAVAAAAPVVVLFAVVLGVVSLAGGGAAAGSPAAAPQAPAAAGVPAQAAVTDAGETAFIRAVLTDIGAPATPADSMSMAAWYLHEYPSWPPGAANNPWDSTLPEPGSTAFNTLPGGGHVWSYPSAAVGAHATALTLEGGPYPRIVGALQSGAGLCGNPSLAGEFLTWSGNGYSGVC